jgi:hypothetical protein
MDGVNCDLISAHILLQKTAKTALPEIVFLAFQLILAFFA